MKRRFLLVGVLLSCTAWARADVVWAHGRSPAVGVDIVQIQDGNLLYRRDVGPMITRAITEIDYIELTGWLTFNYAEEYRRLKKWRQAEESYVKALSEIGRITTGARSLNRRLLIHWRLLGVRDAQGRFDLAVESYLQVVEQMPAAAEVLRPKRIPAADSNLLPPAVEMMSAAMRRHEGSPLGRSLRDWFANWPGEKPMPAPPPASPPPVVRDEPRPAKPVMKPSPQQQPVPREPQAPVALPPVASPAPPAVPAAAEMPAEWAGLIEQRRYDEALERMTELLTTTSGPRRAELYYWQGRTWLEKSGQADGETSRRRAALAFMRVPVHYPRHALAAECLYRAAELCLRGGQRTQAMELCAELLQGYPEAEPWSRKAKELRQAELGQTVQGQE